MLYAALSTSLLSHQYLNTAQVHTATLGTRKPDHSIYKKNNVQFHANGLADCLWMVKTDNTNCIVYHMRWFDL